MSRQFRYRVTAFVLGGLIFGAPLLTNGTASAEQTDLLDEGGRQVTFDGGGMLGLSCRSQPDIESMVVPAESTIRVVNRTGYSARLLLSGQSKGTLPDDAATEVVFRRGTTSVLLKPNCTLGDDDSSPVMVTASPSASAAMPDPIPVPSGGDSAAATPSGSAAGPSGSTSVSTLAGAAPATHSSRLTPATGHAGVRAPASTLRTSTVSQAAATAAQAMPQGGGAARVKSKTSAGTPGSTVPAFAGMPPGDRKALIPGVPPLDLAQATPDAAPAAATPPPTEIAAAEPVAAMTPMRQTAPVGLLGVIAAVCVMGVGAAAIRAIVSQRANRAKVA
ncbi:hypothetical protein ACQP2F_46255 [Actinoplanes sp. CA-030573]|uniref:hypothetical protein n=1 Tax=Actinoplanes sp. CA-030573 TaxID=3239898 RepID=UPI003D8F5FCE